MFGLKFVARLRILWRSAELQRVNKLHTSVRSRLEFSFGKYSYRVDVTRKLIACTSLMPVNSILSFFFGHIFPSVVFPYVTWAASQIRT